jgi:hypothetical protein
MSLTPEHSEHADEHIDAGIPLTASLTYTPTHATCTTSHSNLMNQRLIAAVCYRTPLGNTVLKRVFYCEPGTDDLGPRVLPCKAKHGTLHSLWPPERVL